MWLGNKAIFNSSDQGAAFVALRWHELFDEFTPDTFHPKLFSLPSLVSEAVTVGQLHDDHEAWGKHLTLIQAELNDRLNRGFERTLCKPLQVGMLRTMAETESPSEVVGVGRVLELEGFQSQMEKQIRKQIEHLDFGTAATKKSDTDKILTLFATYAFRNGCSSAECSDVDKIMARSPDEVRFWVLSGVPIKETAHDCVVAVKADPEMFSDIRAVAEKSGIERASPKIPGLSKEANLIFLRRSAEGLRPIDVIESLKKEVRAGLNLVALYRQAPAPRIQPGGWTIGEDGAIEVAERKPSLRNLHPRSNAIDLANAAAEALSLRHGEAPLRAALDLHNLALSMGDHRIRLVNLWSALECLASIVDGDRIMPRVERLVVPLLRWRKIDRMLRYLAISIHFWLAENPKIDRKSLPFGLGHNESVAPDRILTLLAEPKDSSGIRSLMDLVSDHPLLLYRIHEAWKLFHDPKELHSDLKHSGERLKWHLWRIYRARNLLVHQGDEPPCLPQLGNHLQQYFSSTLSRILHGLSLGEAWTSRDSWRYWQVRSEHVIQGLEREPQKLIVDDMFPEAPATPGMCIWPNDAVVSQS